jgi:hypothetical protein
MPFDTIVNPATNRKVSIYSTKGRSILRNYLKVQNGGRLNPNLQEIFDPQELEVLSRQLEQSRQPKEHIERINARCNDVLEKEGADACVDDVGCRYSPAHTRGDPRHARLGDDRLENTGAQLPPPYDEHKRSTPAQCFKKSKPNMVCRNVNNVNRYPNMDQRATQCGELAHEGCVLLPNKSKIEDKTEFPSRCYIKPKPRTTPKRDPGHCALNYGRQSDYYTNNQVIDEAGCRGDVKCAVKEYKKGELNKRGKPYKRTIKLCGTSESSIKKALADAKKSNKTGKGYRRRLYKYLVKHPDKDEKDYKKHLAKQEALRKKGATYCHKKLRGDCKDPCQYMEAYKKGEISPSSGRPYKSSRKEHCKMNPLSPKYEEWKKKNLDRYDQVINSTRTPRRVVNRESGKNRIGVDPLLRASKSFSGSDTDESGSDSDGFDDLGE